jgi:hypothetical protein
MILRVLSAVTLLVNLLGTVGYPAETANLKQEVLEMKKARLAFPTDSSRWTDSMLLS